MLSFRGRKWLSRGDTPSILDRPDTLAETLRIVRALEESGRLSAKQFEDTPAFFARLSAAVSRGETIGIFGDYDCDGITAAALWSRALKRRGNTPVVRLPHRIRDGYGVQARHIDEFEAKGVTLLLLVDTGITAHDALKKAKEKGIDVLIVDHHHAPPALPQATAIVHPVRAAVLLAPPSAATLSFALIEEWEGDDWEGRDTDLALAAIGTVADVMPLTAHNRTLVREALVAMGRLPEGPLKRLLLLSGIEKACTARDIAFGIAPRINAAGRMDDPGLAFRALTEGGDALEQLCVLNNERQLQVEEHLGAFLETVEDAGTPFVFSVSEHYPPGIVGLLAGKLTEQTGRPSLIGSIRGETITASLRSPISYSIAEALDRVSPFLLHYGGHAQAAGCTFKTENADALKRALIADVSAKLTADQLLPVSIFDVTVRSLSGLSTAMVSLLSALEPFGTGNPEPRILIPGALLKNSRRVGSDGSHLQAQIDGIGCIGFGIGDMVEKTTAPLDVLCRLGLNTWKERTSPQIIIEDLRTPIL